MTFDEHATQVLTTMVHALVDNIEESSVTIRKGEQTTVFQINVAMSDRGKIIGKQGRNAQALRQILSALSAKYHTRAVVEIVE